MKTLIAVLALVALVGCGYETNNETVYVTVVQADGGTETIEATVVDSGTPADAGTADVGVDAGTTHGKGHHGHGRP
jgi:hypothetical protein